MRFIQGRVGTETIAFKPAHQFINRAGTCLRDALDDYAIPAGCKKAIHVTEGSALTAVVWTYEDDQIVF